MVLDADLRERDAGEWSGLTRAEIETRLARLPRSAAGRQALGFGPLPERRAPAPAGLGARRLGARAGRCAALRRIDDAVGDGDVLVVTHGGLIYVLEGHLGAGRSPASPTAAAAGSTVDGDRLRLGDRVLLVADDGTPVTVPDQI